MKINFCTQKKKLSLSIFLRCSAFLLFDTQKKEGRKKKAKEKSEKNLFIFPPLVVYTLILSNIRTLIQREAKFCVNISNTNNMKQGHVTTLDV